MRLAIALAVAAPLLLLAGCEDSKDQLLLGTTTSVQDPGLLDELVAAFEDEYDYDVKPIVQGSGQILELARQGEFDVILTHSPADEQKLLDDGLAIDRTPVMQNYFEVVGPSSDPAGVRDADSMADAFALIAEAEASFLSRGDGSGTHKRELAIWEEAGIDPSGQSWYRESSSGQGQTLVFANDAESYTIVDNSTFDSFVAEVDLQELYRDTEKPNVYSVIRLNGGELDDVNTAAGDAWYEFLTSVEGQQLIADYGREDFGTPLFEPLLAQ